jgi:hypothetical protein
MILGCGCAVTSVKDQVAGQGWWVESGGKEAEKAELLDLCKGACELTLRFALPSPLR